MLYSSTLRCLIDIRGLQVLSDVFLKVIVASTRKMPYGMRFVAHATLEALRVRDLVGCFLAWTNLACAVPVPQSASDDVRDGDRPLHLRQILVSRHHVRAVHLDFCTIISLHVSPHTVIPRHSTSSTVRSLRAPRRTLQRYPRCSPESPVVSHLANKTPPFRR